MARTEAEEEFGRLVNGEDDASEKLVNEEAGDPDNYAHEYAESGGELVGASSFLCRFGEIFLQIQLGAGYPEIDGIEFVRGRVKEGGIFPLDGGDGVFFERSERGASSVGALGKVCR